jgi:hypothetical protein
MRAELVDFIGFVARNLMASAKRILRFLLRLSSLWL